MTAPDARLSETANFDAGLLLAAQLADDRGAVAALPALAATLAARVRVRAEALATLTPHARAEALRAAAALFRGVSAERAAGLPARARALLVAEVPRALGASWQAAAPAARRGFAASEGVRAAVRAAAAEVPQHVDGALAARELGRGRAMLARAMDSRDASLTSPLLATLDAAEAGAVLALRPLLGAPNGAADALADALLEGAQRVAPLREVVRALGAMALALEGDGSPGDARSHAWRRVARELAAVEGFAPEAAHVDGEPTP